jgi:hypothetical protein
VVIRLSHDATRASARTEARESVSHGAPYVTKRHPNTRNWRSSACSHNAPRFLLCMGLNFIFPTALEKQRQEKS